MMRSKRTRWALALSFLFLTAAGCDGTPSGLAPYDGPDETLQVRFCVSDLTIELEGTASLADLLQVADQPLLEATEEPVWSTSDESTVLVFPDGTIKAMALGEATVTVDLDGCTAALRVVVIEPKEKKPRDDMEQER